MGRQKIGNEVPATVGFTFNPTDELSAPHLQAGLFFGFAFDSLLPCFLWFQAATWK